MEFKDKYWFKFMIDYFKWVVIEKKDWVCIGDLNRVVGSIFCIYRFVS